MAKNSKNNKKEKSIEESLWDTAIGLRGTVEPSEYKHVVLALLFLKFASDKFVERRKELIEEGKEDFIEMKEFYNQKNVFYLSEESRWSFIKKNAKQGDIALKIDTALNTIEKNNPALKGALPDNYFSRLNLDTSKLATLLDTINNIDTLKDKDQDLVGRVYEYFLKRFAIKEGKGKGEFYTPKTIVNLIAEMIEPYEGVIYDPACGSGGMFVQSIKFIEAHNGNKKKVSIYGQEQISTTYKLAKMNLAIRGISANLGNEPADTFSKDQHKDLKADYIMANPPFNLRNWRAESELKDDPRWMGYEVPPKSNANYAWILNMVSKLSQNGVAGFILANGALSGGGEEYKIRRKLNKKARDIEINGVQKNYRNRENEILFMDLRTWGVEHEKKYIRLTEDEISKIAQNYHNWQQKDYKETYKDVPEFCYSAHFDEIVENDFSLVPSKYIEFVDRDAGIDFDDEMKRIKAEFETLLSEEEQSQKQLKNAFKELGFELDV